LGFGISWVCTPSAALCVKASVDIVGWENNLVSFNSTNSNYLTLFRFLKTLSFGPVYLNIYQIAIW
jgi:hypothetical protein